MVMLSKAMQRGKVLQNQLRRQSVFFSSLKLRKQVDPKGFEPSSGLSSHRIVRLHLHVDSPQFKQIRTFPLLISFFLTLENTSMNNWSKYVI